MVNPGVILLITFAVILTIVAVLLLVWASIEYSNNSNNGNTGHTPLFPCSQNINVSSLIQIPINNSTICSQQGITGTYYYIGNLDSGQYDYVVAKFGTQPLDVCVGFCTGYTGGICNGPTYNGKSSQQNFDTCMSQLSSTTCTPPIPIAAQGTLLYYALSPTCNFCDNCGNT